MAAGTLLPAGRLIGAANQNLDQPLHQECDALVVETVGFNEITPGIE